MVNGNAANFNQQFLSPSTKSGFQTPDRVEQKGQVSGTIHLGSPAKSNKHGRHQVFRSVQPGTETTNSFEDSKGGKEQPEKAAFETTLTGTPLKLNDKSTTLISPLPTKNTNT